MILGPSLQSGYARSPGESEYPHLWSGLMAVYAPCLGFQGNTINCAIGRGPRGTLTNDNDANPTWTTHKHTALLFARPNVNNGSYVTLGAVSAAPPLAAAVDGVISVVALVQPAAIGVAASQVFSSASAGNQQDLNLEVNRTSGRVSTVWGDAVIATGATTMVVNEWYTIGISRRGVAGAWTGELYLNGREDATFSTATNPNGTTGAWAMIGAVSNTSETDIIQTMDGQIAFVAVYNWGVPPGFHKAFAEGRYPWTPKRRPEPYIVADSGGVAQGSGTAAGASSVDGRGNMRVQASGTSAGVGAATGIGNMRVQASGTTAGTGTADGRGGGSGTSAGIGTATGTGVMRVPGSGTAAGVGAATGIAQFNIPASGTAAGVGTATGVGHMRVQASGTAAGVGAATGVGLMRVQAFGTAGGTSTVDGIASGGTGTGTAAGTSSVDGIGNMRVQASGTSAGIGAATGTGVMRVQASGTAAGIGTADGIGRPRVQASGTAAGVGAGTGSALARVQASGTAAGIGTATGTGVMRVQGSGTAAGVGTADGRAPAGTQGTGTASGTGTATGTGVMRVQGSGTASGSCSVVGMGRDGSQVGTGGTKFFYGVGR